MTFPACGVPPSNLDGNVQLRTNVNALLFMKERRVSKSPLSLATGISKVRSAQHSAQLTPVVEHSYYVTDTRGHPLLLQMRRRVPAIAPFDPGGVGAPGGVRRVDQGPG